MRRSLLVILLLMPGAAAGRAQSAPQLEFEVLGADVKAQSRLSPVNQEQLRATVRLVGLEDPGGAVRVVLAGEDTDVARATPSWIAGFAHPPADTVVLFPARSLRYPHDSLEAVLHHEIAHILIARAAGGQPVPRWFNEGLATAAERAWHFEDGRRLAWALVRGSPITMDALDALFARGNGHATTAYALASAFVRDVMDTHGPLAPAAILAAQREEGSFPVAFERATGERLDRAERRFAAGLRSWERWVPLATSPFVLWTAVTLLALYAIRVRIRRKAERRQRWDEEEDEELGDVELSPADLDRVPPDGAAALQAGTGDPTRNHAFRAEDFPDDEPPPIGGRR
ncbi:hypothetical protein BH24ACI4_BH24ACI4_00170 [soil metagenome]